MAKLSIIIVSYNTAELTISCLNSLDSALKKHSVDAEVIVVDNASSDDSVKQIQDLRKKTKNIIFIQNKKNLGFGKANNLALPKVGGEYVLFLNSDTLVYDLNFAEILKVMDEDRKIGVLTVRVNLENGRLDPASHRGFPTVWRSFTYFSKLEDLTRYIPFLNQLFGGYHLTHLNLKHTHEIESPSGAFYLTRKSILDELHGFDEAFFMYGEDLDLSLRIKKLGYKILFYPHQTIVHLKGKSGIKNNDPDAKNTTRKHFYEAMKIFYDKHFLKKYPNIITKLVYFFINSKLKS